MEFVQNMFSVKFRGEGESRREAEDFILSIPCHQSFLFYLSEPNPVHQNHSKHKLSPGATMPIPNHHHMSQVESMSQEYNI